MQLILTFFLKNYAFMYMRRVGAGQMSNIPVAIKPAYFLKFLLFLPHGNRSLFWGHLSPLAQKYNKEYKIYKDTAGNKCLLSSLPATHRNHSKELEKEKLTIWQILVPWLEIHNAILCRLYYAPNHLWIKLKYRFWSRSSGESAFLWSSQMMSMLMARRAYGEWPES